MDQQKLGPVWEISSQTAGHSKSDISHRKLVEPFGIKMRKFSAEKPGITRAPPTGSPKVQEEYPLHLDGV